MIRLARESDIEKSIDLIKEFHQESLKEYGFQVDPEKAKLLFKQYVATSLVIDLEDKIVGVISGTINTFPTDGSKVFQEVVWYVSKKYRKYGVLLLKKLEDYCQEQGVTHIVMANMANLKAEKLAKFYKRLGFKELEVHYIKKI